MFSIHITSKNPFSILYKDCPYKNNEEAHNLIEKWTRRGAWMVQLVEYLNLNFGSGHHFTVVRSSPALSSVLSIEPPWASLSLSLSLSLCPSSTHAFSL